MRSPSLCGVTVNDLAKYLYGVKPYRGGCWMETRAFLASVGFHPIALRRAIAYHADILLIGKQFMAGSAHSESFNQDNE